MLGVGARVVGVEPPTLNDLAIAWAVEACVVAPRRCVGARCTDVHRCAGRRCRGIDGRVPDSGTRSDAHPAGRSAANGVTATSKPRQSGGMDMAALETACDRAV